jgi:hypothetical protein
MPAVWGERTGRMEDPVRLVVVIDMQSNNNRALPMIDAETGGSMDWMADFASMQDVLALKEQHPLGRFPWVVLDLDRPQANSVLL